MKKGKTPLWIRAIKDPAAVAWREAHKEEFPVASFLPDPISYNEKILMDREKAADILRRGMPYENPAHQKLAELVLKHSPRKVAKLLEIDRKEVYWRIKALKDLSLKKWHDAREELVLARSRGARGGPVAAQNPEGIAIRSVVFTLGERQRTAHLVQLGSQRTWLDEAGQRFTPEVQVILHNLETYGSAFSDLEVVEYGAAK